MKALASKLFGLFACRTALIAFIAVWILSFVFLTFSKFFPLVSVYSSTARIKLEGSATNLIRLQNQLNFIRSPSVLKSVVVKLDLEKTWVHRWKLPEGFKFTNPEPWQMLSDQMFMSPVKNSALVDITCFSEIPHEADLIVNCMAETFRDFMAENPRQIQIQIVDRALPSLQPWKQPHATALLAIDMAFTTFFAAIGSVLAVLGRYLLRKFLALKISSPVVSNHTFERITSKY
jgi:capsular polysaccharide biosynthesis protein